MATNTLQISVRDAMLPVIGGKTLYDSVRAVGLDAVELLVDEQLHVPALRDAAGTPRSIASATEAADLRRVMDAEKLRTSALLLMTDYSGPRADEHVRWTVRAVVAANEMGVPAVRIDPLTADKTVPRDRMRDNLIACIGRVLKDTAGSGVDLAMENHGPVANEPAFIDEVLAGVGDHRLGLTLDTGNFYWFGFPLDDLYDLIAHFAPRAKHTHLKSIAYPPELASVRRPIGQDYGKYCCGLTEGNLDLKRVIAILRVAGYTRDLCIENESIGKKSPEEKIEALKRDVAALHVALNT